MRIGLLADTHDRVPAVTELLRRMREAGVHMVLHAGDFCSPFIFRPFHEASMPIAGVFGRNDGDHAGLRAAAASVVGAELYESPHSLEVDGERILVVHDLGDVPHGSITKHALVVHGCSHREEMKTRGDTLLVNPGEGCGWLYGAPTAAIIDLQSKKVEILKLTDPEWRS